MSDKAADQVTTIGIDIGKNTCHLIGFDAAGNSVPRRKLSRGRLEGRLANVTACLIGMEACVGAHHLSRRLPALGHLTASQIAAASPASFLFRYTQGFT